MSTRCTTLLRFFAMWFLEVTVGVRTDIADQMNVEEKSPAGPSVVLGDVRTRIAEQARDELKPCSVVSSAVRAQAASGEPGWEGVYNCLKNHAHAIIMCDNDEEIGVPACWVPPTEDNCARVSLSVRTMAKEGAQGWQGVYKCTHTDNNVVVIKCDNERTSNNEYTEPKCWVHSEKSDIQSLWDSIGSVVDAVASLVMPVGPSDDGLRQAIQTFKRNAAAAGEDGPTYHDIHELQENWRFMTPFEKEVTVLMLNNAQPSSSLLQESNAEHIVAKTEGFWSGLFRFIAFLFRAGYNSRGRAAQNHYMGMNRGWDHVRTNMRRDGWRW